MIATTSSAAVPRSSRARSAETSDASPRGPNQPTNSTVLRSSPAPQHANATGTIRTSVRLSIAYATTARSARTSTIGMASAPNANQTSIETSPAA